MRLEYRAAAAVLAGAILLAVLLAIVLAERPDSIRATLTVAEILGNGDEGFVQAMAPRTFRFPADHGPHPEYRTEWWYFTGNLRARSGRHFGFQLTFFRFALSPERGVRSSAWASNQIYMAHFALTDVASGRFHAFERFSRAALGLAGGRAEPFRVWLEDWVAESIGEGFQPLRLKARDAGVGIDLRLDGAKAPVFHGDQGLSRKSARPGNASFYYSFTRMPVAGTVALDGQQYQVQGAAWLDREWSTSALDTDQVGWDWFALQLSDGSELMYYQLRRENGEPHPFSAGITVTRDGTGERLSWNDVRVTVLDHWSSPAGEARYPARWRLLVPREQLRLEVSPLVANQEIRHSFRYWEGAVRIAGTRGANRVEGFGYVELTGYASNASQGTRFSALK